MAQIYRTWQDRAGHKWINACWYYRPEQTVHRYEKHFFEHEVVKTGQYRDHQIEDVLDRCFVMFVTRFNKGRPRGFPADKEVYVCESRYNEERFTFNKIKTWASCVPDEVRDKDYEMDLFDAPRRMKKIPSPIKHLLREDAKETDELPKPTWGSPTAPPIVGAVHRRPRESNVSEAHLFIVCLSSCWVFVRLATIKLFIILHPGFLSTNTLFPACPSYFIFSYQNLLNILQDPTNRHFRIRPLQGPALRRPCRLFRSLMLVLTPVDVRRCCLCLEVCLGIMLPDTLRFLIQEVRRRRLCHTLRT